MENEKRILLIGGGGHCHSVLDCIIKSGKYREIGIVDIDLYASCMGVPVVGQDADLPNLLKDGWTDAFVTIGSIGNTSSRRRLYAMLKGIGFSIPLVVDESAVIARDAKIGCGTFIGKRAVINAGCEIGECSIINTASVIEHNCHIGEFVHISPGSILCGEVVVGSDCHVGAGSVIRQGIELGDNTLIGIGSVVTKNIPSHVLAYGNPCRVVKR